MKGIEGEHFLGTEQDTELTEQQQEFIRNLEATKYILKKDYGVDDMSTIEGARLRPILAECLREADEQGEEIIALTNAYDAIRKKEGEDSENARKAKRELESLSRISFDPKKESIARWLYDAYNISLRDIPYKINVIDKTTGETFMGFLGYYSPRSMEEIGNEEDLSERIDNFFVSDEAAEKIRELKAMGHAVSREEKVEDKFKEYLRRTRENAHLISSATPRKKKRTPRTGV